VTTDGTRRGRFAGAQPSRARRTIAYMVGKPDGAPAVRMSRQSGWAGLGAFSVFLLTGLVTRLPGDEAVTTSGVLIAFAASIPIFLAHPRFPLVYASIATVGVVMLSNADSRDIGWFAVLVLAGWCVLAGRWSGATYWAGSVVLFGREWLLAPHDPGWGAWVVGVTFTVIAAALVRHQLMLVERLRAAQADLAERSRADERSRIGRELHDVIAHSLTVSLLHIASARLAVEHEPHEAIKALLEAERVGRQSLAEVRSTMGLPHHGDHASGGIALPVPGITDLVSLVEQARVAGVDASLVIEGNIAALPATIGSTAYRIVQEALTNAAKHAPSACVAVRVAVARQVVSVDVDSAGAPRRGSGMGLLSMQDRAEAVGGTCTAGPGGSGWLVHASLPLEVEARLDVS
jgi:signal transduction histidine kinase